MKYLSFLSICLLIHSLIGTNDEFFMHPLSSWQRYWSHPGVFTLWRVKSALKQHPDINLLVPEAQRRIFESELETHDQFNPLLLNTYNILSTIPVDSQDDILSLGALVPNQPNVIHQRINLVELNIRHNQANLLQSISNLPQEQKNILIPQIQAKIIANYSNLPFNPQVFDPPSINTQEAASNIQDQSIKELLINLGQLGDNDSLKTIINVEHIFAGHLPIPNIEIYPDLSLTKNMDNKIEFEYNYNTKKGKTIFSSQESKEGLVITLYSIKTTGHPHALAERRSGDKYIKIYGEYNQTFIIVWDEVQTSIITAYPIFAYHDFEDGDLSLNLSYQRGNEIDSNISYTIPKERLLNFARNSLQLTSHWEKNLKFEMGSPGNKRLIINIGYEIKNNIFTDRLSIGDYLPLIEILLEIPKSNFPKALFGHLYAPGELETTTIIPIQSEEEFPSLPSLKLT